MPDPVLDELRSACGAEHAWPAAGADTVAGCRPRYVAAPAETAETAAVLRVAHTHGLRVVARGAGTKLDWGRPPEGVELVIDSGRMDQVVEYSPADLVLRVQAGARLDRVQRECAGAGLHLALDPVPPGGSIGGTIAANASGPYRMSRGTCRDLLIGITVVLADGTVAHSGGKVVKNVAGYDLGKLYVGSFGTLGVVTEAVFRLHPRPHGRAVASCAFEEVAAAAAAAHRVRRSQLAVAALEVDRPDPAAPLRVAALIEGAGAAARAGEAAVLLGRDGTVAEQVPPWWDSTPWPRDGTALKLAVRLSTVDAVLGALQRHGAGLPLRVRGSIGAGVLYAGLPAGIDRATLADLVAAVRSDVAVGDGSVVVLRTPAPDGLDLWGPVSGLPMMRQVKARFDPQRLLSPGRFVGGI
jgi:glycolate oxidase FAD binding subunit